MEETTPKARLLSLMMLLVGCISITSAYTGQSATVEFTPYPGTSYEGSGSLTLEEYIVDELVGLRIKGSYTIVGENGKSGLHMHVGMDPYDATTIGPHYWEPTTEDDPWTAFEVNLAHGTGRVDMMTTDLYPIYGFSFDKSLPSAGRVMVAHAVNGDRALAGKIVLN